MTTKIYIGYIDVFGGKKSRIESVINEIKSYNKRNLLILLIQLVFYIDLQDRLDKADIKITKTIFHFLEDDFKKVSYAVRIAIKRNIGKKVFVIYRRSLLLLIRLVIENASSNQGTFFDKSDIGKIGGWLLKINDFLGEKDKFPKESIILPSKQFSSSRAIAIIQFSVRQYYFESMRLQNSFELFFRYLHIFDIISKKYTDLEEVFISTTGVSLQEYTDLLYLFLSEWNNIDTNRTALSTLKIFPEEEFKEFSKDSIDLIRSQLSLKYKDYSDYII